MSADLGQAWGLGCSNDGAVGQAWGAWMPVISPHSQLQRSHHQCRPDAEVFVTKTNITIGSVYKKAVYRQYTDARFNQRVRCDSREAHACARCSCATHWQRLESTAAAATSHTSVTVSHVPVAFLPVAF